MHNTTRKAWIVSNWPSSQIQHKLPVITVSMSILRKDYNLHNCAVIATWAAEKKFDILKAPYRFKMSRNQLYFSRFNIILSFFFFKNFSLVEISTIVYLMNKIFLFFSYFEVNLCTQNYIRTQIKFKNNTNFLL